MAYGQMYQGYGNNMYGNSGYGQMYPQQSYQVPNPQSFGQAQGQGLDWVDGEAAARAMQLPAGVTQHAMWDINEPIIYLKSVNQMGMPNPLRKIRYTVEETQQSGAGQSQAMLTSGETERTAPDMTQYIRRDETDGFVRKEDMERMKHELLESIQGISAGTQGAVAARRGTKGE